MDSYRIPSHTASLRYSAVHGDDPSYLPTPGRPAYLGVAPPASAESGHRIMMSNGLVWEYRGISGYTADDRFRVNGWLCVTEGLLDILAVVAQFNGAAGKRANVAKPARTFARKKS